jgi:hypothetical protein
MPCLNEAATLATCIRKARRALENGEINGEIIIADNGSTDGSPDIAEAEGARVIHVSGKGYGAALMGGISAAHGRYVLMADADDSYDLEDLPLFLEALRDGADLVMGNRFLGGIKPGAMPPLNRFLGNPVLSFLGRLFFKAPCRDFHCGIRAFRKDAYARMDLRTTGMEFASEMVVKATVFGMNITEVPTTLSPDGRGRAPHLRPWRDGWRHLRFLLLYSPRWLFLYPGLAFMVAGLLATAWLMPGPRHVGGMTLDIHTLVYALLAVIVGFQVVCFAVLTKVFAISEGLLPQDRRLDWLFRYVTLESALIVGGALVLAGFAGSLLAVDHWRALHFGELNPAQTMRLVSPAAVSFALGIQVIFTGCFLSILGMRRK